MRKETFLFISGILVFITPFLGVPESWRSILLFVLGTGVVLAALRSRLAVRKEERFGGDDVLYAENEPMTHTVGDF